MADIPGDLSTTSTLTVGGSTTNVLAANGDHDWFAINLVAGQQVTASVFGITLVDPLLNIRDSSGQVIFTNDEIKSGTRRLPSRPLRPAPITSTLAPSTMLTAEPTRCPCRPALSRRLRRSTRSLLT